MRRQLSVLAVVVLGTACATTGTVTSESPEAGRAFRFAEACARVTPLVVPTLEAFGFVVRSADSAEPCGTTVVARKPVSLASWGELVRVTVRPVDGGTEVRILTRRALATNVTARGDWSGEIYRELLRGLDGTEAGNDSR